MIISIFNNLPLPVRLFLSKLYFWYKNNTKNKFNKINVQYFLEDIKQILFQNDISKYRKNIKIYDTFYFYNELELLDIRLNILNDYVDYFVIIEATETFSGLPKKLYYYENRDKFKEFEHKIIHYVTTNSPCSEDELRSRLYLHNYGDDIEKEIIVSTLRSDNVPKGEVHWLKEFYQKEMLKKALVGLSDNDFVYISDVDEIWNPHSKINYTKDDLFKYKQIAYYYYLNNRSNDDWHTGWTGTVATKYKNIKNECVNHLRTISKNNYHVINNGGWHFTFQGGEDRIKSKLKSYGHQEFNNDNIKSNIKNVLDHNLDYRGRNLSFWIDESRLPRYILANKVKYSNLFK